MIPQSPIYGYIGKRDWRPVWDRHKWFLFTIMLTLIFTGWLLYDILTIK